MRKSRAAFSSGLATISVLCHDEVLFMRWIVPALNSDAVARLVKGEITPLLARLLVLRGVEDPEAAKTFLSPSLSALHDPFLMAGMEEAVARLARTKFSAARGTVRTM